MLELLIPVVKGVETFSKFVDDIRAKLIEVEIVVAKAMLLNMQHIVKDKTDILQFDRMGNTRI
ncbi:hypothetical protein C122C_1213 [Leuconostoc gelidum subsp. gasicomitatum]|uniref:Uncharacterized protein n=1 Tax=Leuconostoc gasicomitatum TaxID=115778 RepID=A0A9Q3SX56_9LACO|nr:hypothetical protein [Leuconostoc gasicomitatum]MBZ5944603.1 hypothetical protein [Leuconostoc gasicomitatum]MBZ5945464.1 hypothetical protein [Leuconostoc gasicomitatum]MBZ5949505.1 hypothetical protein [Leuconostoc gasicomitatum]MBZ5951553.1 hypothetical protein [Leuconostoc gasicomitatum]MBZ5962479.1 hypothetical protein [Leuconostoc gasicomitatum]